jgi:transcriptional regulator GlxA family with amidase domain
MISATPRAIGVLIFPDFQLLDAAGPITAFEIASRYGAGAYALSVVSAQAGQVLSSSGVAMSAVGFDEAPALDTLIVAGGDGVDQAVHDPVTLGYIRAAAQRTRRTVSVCSGALLLAQAGLLDGRVATTHWSRTAQFARQYPKVRLEPDRIFTRDGAIWTSAGITAGIDLSLALIADDLSEAIARKTAQQMVVYRQRPGGQSQFSAVLEMERREGRFAGLLGWMGEHLDQALTVDDLAARAAMSPRNFARRFVAETGVTPARAVERLRVEAARDQIESGPDPMDQIARRTGFGDVERMRQAFLRAFGQPPQALRRGARAGGQLR